MLLNLNYFLFIFTSATCQLFFNNCFTHFFKNLSVFWDQKQRKFVFFLTKAAVQIHIFNRIFWNIITNLCKVLFKALSMKGAATGIKKVRIRRFAAFAIKNKIITIKVENSRCRKRILLFKVFTILIPKSFEFF